MSYQRFKRKIEKHIERYTLLNEHILKNCVEHILSEYQRRKEDNGAKPLNIILTEEEEARTKAQNRLMWKWYRQIGNHRKIGMTDNEVHDTMRAMFLLQIYRTEYPEYEAVASDFIGDKLGNDEWQAKIKLGKMCSTTGSNASVKTMTRYLDEIYKWAYINQIPLITPDELKWVRN